MDSGINFKQGASVSVTRSKAASIREQYLETPIVCQQCGNNRRWKVRCEYCGLTVKVKENAK